MRILFIAEEKHYKNWIGKTYSDLLVYYKNNSKNDVTIVYTGEKIKNFIKPDIIVFLDTDTLRFAKNYKNLFNLKIPIYGSGLDLFNFDRRRNGPIHCPYIKKCNGILHFGHASKLLSSYKEYFPNKIIKSFKGRFVNSNRFKNYKLNKKYDILIYGTRSFQWDFTSHKADQEYKKKWEKHNNKKIPNEWHFYPLRYRLENLLIKNKDKYNVYILKGACINNAVVANEDLSKLINQSWLTLSSCSRADIPMAKYFEIAASYSGILGNIPSDYNDLFKNNIVEVTEWMTDEEILFTIDEALKNKKKLQEMINRLGDRIHKEYNLEAGTKDMDRVFNDLINL